MDTKDYKFVPVMFMKNRLKSNPLFISLKNEFDIAGKESINHKGYNVEVYRPEMMFVLTSDQLRVLDTLKQTESVINGCNLIINYVAGYQAGSEYFEKEIKPNKNTLYGPNAQNYMRDLHDKYFHNETSQPSALGWGFVRRKYPIIITGKIITAYGYYAALVSKTDELKEDNLTSFRGFNTCPRCQKTVKNELLMKALLVSYFETNNIQIQLFHTGNQRFKDQAILDLEEINVNVKNRPSQQPWRTNSLFGTETKRVANEKDFSILFDDKYEEFKAQEPDATKKIFANHEYKDLESRYIKYYDWFPILEQWVQYLKEIFFSAIENNQARHSTIRKSTKYDKALPSFEKGKSDPNQTNIAWYQEISKDTQIKVGTIKQYYYRFLKKVTK